MRVKRSFDVHADRLPTWNLFEAHNVLHKCITRYSIDSGRREIDLAVSRG